MQYYIKYTEEDQETLRIKDKTLPRSDPKFTEEFTNLEKVTLPETNIALENRPGPKRKRSSSNDPFFRGELLVAGRVEQVISYKL